MHREPGRTTIAGIAFALLFLPQVTANAALITETVSVTANDIYRFLPTFSGPGIAPIDPVSVSFTLTYDPALAYVDNTANITLNSTNLVLDYPLAFSYDPNDVNTFGGTIPGGRLRVGGLFGGDAFGTNADRVQVSPTTNDFWLYIDDFNTAPEFLSLGYAQTAQGNNNLYGTLKNEPGFADSDVTFTVTDETTPGGVPVPEPSSMILWGTGLLAMGFLRRRRRSADTACSSEARSG